MQGIHARIKQVNRELAYQTAVQRRGSRGSLLVGSFDERYTLKLLAGLQQTEPGSELTLNAEDEAAVRSRRQP